jgi:hypothetical protein
MSSWNGAVIAAGGIVLLLVVTRLLRAQPRPVG